MQPLPSSANPLKFDAIEGLRGILAVMVCFGHFGLGQLFEKMGLAFAFHFAVDIFFVISGFVMAYSNYYAKETVSTYAFVVKRFARLYPLHFITLLLMMFVAFWAGEAVSYETLIQNGLLLHNVGLSSVNHPLNFPSWSIAVEFWVSIILLIMIRFVAHKKVMALGLCALVVLIALAVPQMILNGDYEGQYYHLNAGLLRALSGMSLGVLIYLTYESPFLKKILVECKLGYIACLGLLGYGLLPSPHQSALLFYALVFAFVSQLVMFQDQMKLLRLRLLVWLGSISYAIYLLHIPLYRLVQWCFGDLAVKGWLGKAILLPLVFFAAALVYQYFERPIQRIIRKSLLRERWYQPNESNYTNSSETM